MAGVRQAFTVQGPQQAIAMLTGDKLIENRSWRIASGCYALHVGGTRNSYWGQEAARQHQELPRNENNIKGIPLSSIVGLVFISERRTVGECAGDFWARGPHCHVVARAVQLERPIP